MHSGRTVKHRVTLFKIRYNLLELLFVNSLAKFSHLDVRLSFLSLNQANVGLQSMHLLLILVPKPVIQIMIAFNFPRSFLCPVFNSADVVIVKKI